MVNDEKIIDLDKKDIHTWFELSYAQYLTIPRSVLQSMPAAWQERFVTCLEELDESIDWRPEKGSYRCQLFSSKEKWNRDEQRFENVWDKELEDPLMDYERGRRRIELMNQEKDSIMENKVHVVGGKILSMDDLEAMNREEVKNRKYTHCTIDAAEHGQFKARVFYNENVKAWEPSEVLFNGKWITAFEFDETEEGGAYGCENWRFES